MNFAVLTIERFALHALKRSDPALTGKAVALVTGEGRKAIVSEATAETGLAPGLTVTLAMARCPDLIIGARSPTAEQEAQNLLLAAGFTLSPRVEATAAGSCTVDLQGTDPVATERALRLAIVELAHAGLPAKAGVAATPLLARYAASQAEPVRMVWDTAAFLRDLPLTVAEPSPAHVEILHGWGIKTLGDLTALKKADIAQRLGSDGVALWERAAGETTRVLRLIEPAKSFVADWNYEPPIDTLEPLTFKLRRFSERIVMELRATGFVAEMLMLTLRMEDETDYRREFRLPEPGADVDTWLRVLLTHLEPVRLPSNLTGVRLIAKPTRPKQKQDGLFDTGLRDSAAFWENLARMEAMLGKERVGTPVMLDTHKPDAFVINKPADAIPPPAMPAIHPLRGLPLRRFRPPWPVRVNLCDERPAELSGALAGDIAAIAGPWQADGDWWKPEAWTEETWQVEINGAAYLLARGPDGWRVEGVFD